MKGLEDTTQLTHGYLIKSGMKINHKLQQIGADARGGFPSILGSGFLVARARRPATYM